jgi:hypothetical protein
MRARRAHAQVIIIFAAALPALLGFLGLALDGGYYLAVGESVQFAATAAARAAATDVEDALYASATSDGQTIGQNNLSTLELSGVSITITYNNTAGAAPGAAGWSAATPTASTRSVQATVSGTHSTLFLKLLQVPTVDLQRLAVVTIPRVLPLAVCQAVSNAMDTNPTVQQEIWRNKSTQCGVKNWDGVVSVGGAASCPQYQALIQPQPSGPPPKTNSNVVLDAASNCAGIDNWIAAYPTSVPPVSMVQPIVVVTTTGTVLGCRLVTLATAKDVVNGTPAGPLRSCRVMQQTS